MREMQIQGCAQLLDAHGDKAVVEAAQKSLTLEEQGQHEEAGTWRRVEAALRIMRGANQS